MALFLRTMRKRKRIKTLSSKNQLRFIKRLIRLMKTGYPLLQSLEMTAWDGDFKSTSNKLSHSLKTGKHIDEAFGIAGFSSLIIEQLYFVRFNGELLATLQKCHDTYEQRLKYQAKFVKVIRYPTVLLLIFTILMYFMKSTVLPAFLEMFQHHDQSRKTVTISLFLMNTFITIIFIAIISGIIAAVLGLFMHKKLHIREQIKILRHIPVLRIIIKWRTSFQFASHMATLLRTGFSLNNVLNHMIKQDKFSILSYYASILMLELKEGQPISQILKTFNFIDEQIIYIFENQSEASSLSQDLEVYSDLLTDRIENFITKALTYIQPLFLGLVAIFIVLIYISLLYPMFQLLQTM